MIVVVDSKLGNVGSILNMLKKIGAEATASADPAVVERADKVILPGVGSFDRGMQTIRRAGLIPALNRVALEQNRPVLGICLGMQLMTRRSQEGTEEGLGWFDAETVRFEYPPQAADCKTPHMGWNTVEPARRDGLFGGFAERPRFYFVHSYHVVCGDRDVLGTTRHGVSFASSIQKGNICGTQFHPEKSHRFGLRLLRNFVEMS